MLQMIENVELIITVEVSGDWNREHVFSQSLADPPLSDTGPGSDAHHLRPAEHNRNSSRNNRKFTGLVLEYFLKL